MSNSLTVTAIVDQLTLHKHMLIFTREQGLIIDGVIFDDCIHRVETINKPKSNNGWYSTFANGKGIVAGDWQTGLVNSWHSNSNLNTEQHKSQLRETIQQQKTKKNQEQQLTAIDADKKYNKCKAALQHPYLSLKNIPPVKGLRIFRNSLFVPLGNIETNNNQIMNIQSIQGNGNKHFMKGGRVNGLCFPVGRMRRTPEVVYITEGVATAISVYINTNCLVLAAMNAGNLKPVALTARYRWPKARIIIAGDDDWLTQQRTNVNPGVEKATEAAIAVGGFTSFPPFTEEQRENNLTDWNDFLHGHVRGSV